MRTKNTTPFLFGSSPASLRPPRPCVSLVVRGAFRLAPGEPVETLLALGAQGALSGDEFLPDDDDRRGALVRASDFAEFKPKVDVLVRASCHTPGARPMTECPVRFSVGPVSKLLRVVGRRVWQGGLLGDSPGKPEPFTSSPIDYWHAFGGPAHPQNPSGKGVGTPELPNVEGPSDVLASRSDRFPPRGFGPLSPFWPERKARLGKEYGKSYREKRAPYHAEDFDWAYFNAAPEDQQVDELRGDEEMSFQNLHPRSALFTARMPGVRVRIFLRDREARDRGGREVRVRLDTVLADLEGEALYLTWRGVEEVAESDLADVTSVLVAREALSEEPRPAEHYLRELEEFERDPVANDPRHPKREPPPDPAADEDPEDPLWKALSPKLEGLPGAQRLELRRLLQTVAARSTPDLDYRAKMLAALSAAGSPPPPIVPVAPGQSMGVSLRGQASSVQDAVRRLRAQLRGAKVDPRVTGALDALERQPFSAPGKEAPPFFAGADPTLGDGEPGADDPGPGADLHGRDLSGQDLSGEDLSKANLRGANLSGANLENANLAGANLDHALLYEARLAGADLSGASLRVAQLSKASGEGVKLVGARLDGASFQGAELPGADLSGASGRFAIFSKAGLAGARLADAALEGCLFEGTRLEGAVFSRAALQKCRFLGCEAAGADFERAALDGASFTDSNLERAVFVEASGKGSIWMRARLGGADLRYAVLPDAHFQEASAAEARLSAADLSRVRFYRTSLVKAELLQTNLLEADLRRADLSGAKLAGANLYAAQLLSAVWAGAVFDGANLRRTLLEGGRE